jgi:hypothetical protein
VVTQGALFSFPTTAVDPIWFIFSARVDGTTVRAERREIGGDAEFSFVLASSDGADGICWGAGVEANTREVGKIRLCVGSAGALSEDSEVEGTVARTEVWAGKGCRSLSDDSKEERTGAGTVKLAGSSKWAGIGGGSSTRVDPVEAMFVRAEG